LTGPSGLNGTNTDYWETRMRDAPGTGSNTPARRPSSSNDPSTEGMAGPASSDLFAQVMAELDAQQTGAPSPTERDVHLRMLRGQ
jgi:hypothetical protein